MWIIGYIILTVIFSALYWRKYNNFVESFFSGLSWALSMWLIMMIIYDNRKIEDYEAVYEYSSPCLLSEGNYNENRELILGYHQFPQMIECEWSEKRFYRIDVYTIGDGSPFSTYWVEHNNLKFEYVEDVVPRFKKVEKYVETDIPFIFKLFLHPKMMEDKPKSIQGILYLPHEPILYEERTPMFLEYDLRKHVSVD